MNFSVEEGFVGWLDRLSWKHLMAVFVVMTFGGACGYTILNRFIPNADIVPTYLRDGELDSTPMLVKSLYFSIVTEATVGYGDYRPTGASRLLACIQVLAGYALFGIIVSKLTSSLGAQSRRIQRLVCGVWYNYTIHEDDRITIDICQIFPSETNGNLRFCGSNYDEGGELLGPYESDLISASWPALTFIYRDAPNNKLPWSEGMMSVVFVQNRDKAVNSFSGTTREFRDGKVATFQGWRLDNDPNLMARLDSENRVHFGN